MAVLSTDCCAPGPEDCDDPEDEGEGFLPVALASSLGFDFEALEVFPTLSVRTSLSPSLVGGVMKDENRSVTGRFKDRNCVLSVCDAVCGTFFSETFAAWPLPESPCLTCFLTLDEAETLQPLHE